MFTSTHQCTVDDVTLCRCNLNPSEIIHGADASFYPKAGCFRMGKILYSARSCYSWFGRHMWEILIHNPGGVRQSCVYHSYHSINVRVGTGISFYFMPTINGLLPSVHIRRIQRAMRMFLQRKFEQRALAMTMGLHGRLGVTSCLSGLPEDIVARILAIY